MTISVCATLYMKMYLNYLKIMFISCEKFILFKIEIPKIKSVNLISGGKRSIVMLDVDSKDNTVGISCPPEVFLQLEFLENIKSILLSNGKYQYAILKLIKKKKKVTFLLCR